MNNKAMIFIYVTTLYLPCLVMVLLFQHLGVEDAHVRIGLTVGSLLLGGSACYAVNKLLEVFTDEQ